MRESFVVLDATGRALDVGTSGVGFRLVPARGQEHGAQARPGNYPIRLKPNGGTDVKHVTSDDTRVLKESFRFLTIEGGEAGDIWKLQILEAPGERIDPGSRSSVPVSVQAATACPTIAPTLSTEGIKVRPGTLAHTFYASGVPVAARIWVRSARGVWYDTGEDLDFTLNAVQLRAVYNTADRVYLRAAAGGMNIEIDSEVQTG